MAIRPQPYTDGVDRIVIQVKHKIDREQFVRTLALSFLDNDHGKGTSGARLSQQQAIYRVHRELAISGRFAGDVWIDPIWLTWARDQVDRIWPPKDAG